MWFLFTANRGDKRFAEKKVYLDGPRKFEGEEKRDQLPEGGKHVLGRYTIWGRRVGTTRLGYNETG